MTTRIETAEELSLLLIEEGPKGLRKAFWSERVISNPKTLQAVLDMGDPEMVYWFAMFSDRGPRPETRALACQDPHDAFFYAKEIDRKPTDETRAGAAGHPEYERTYRLWEKSLQKKK